MNIRFIHPSIDALTKFANHTGDESGRTRIAEHLETCTSCRSTVSLLRDVRANAGVEAPAAEPSENLLNRILQSRDDGKRVILPLNDPVPASSRWAVGLAAAGLVLLAGIGLLATGRASAENRTGELEFDPARPQRGETVSVTYTPAGPLAGRSHLLLRARYRSSTADGYNEGPMQSVVGELARGRDGLFHATVALPDSVVYAVFAVEGPDKQYVDHNDRALWELLIHGSDGRPLNEALQQKVNDLMGRNWELAFEAAKWRAELYPDRPGAWGLLHVFERWVLGRDAADSLRASHRERFLEFHEKLSREESPDVEIVYGMWWYAMSITGVRTQGLYWQDRLRRDFPTYAWVLFERENEIGKKYRDESLKYLAEVEPLWQTLDRQKSRLATSTRDAFVNNALNRAIHSESPEWTRRWMVRFDVTGDMSAEAVEYRAGSMLEKPGLHDEAIYWIRRELRRLESGPGEYRTLTQDGEQYHTENRKAAQPLLAQLGNALLTQGDTTAGLDSLNLAAAYGWNPAVFRSIGETRLALGDTIGALENFAKVVVDPISDTLFADSVPTLVGSAFDLELWYSSTRNAQEEMQSWVLADASPRRLSEPVRLSDQNGSSQTLRELTDGKVSVVIFWNRACGPALHKLPDIRALVRRLQQEGVAAVAITDEQPSEEFRKFWDERELSDFPLFHDYKADASRAFINFTTPEYHILDANGRLVFSASEFDEIPRQVAVLKPLTP